jgi:LPXTG-motif cell wall-anchored protein
VSDGSWRRHNLMVRFNMPRAVSGFARLLFFLGLRLVSVCAVARPIAPAETLPKTGSEQPLIALLGLLCLSASFGVKLLRANIGV